MYAGVGTTPSAFISGITGQDGSYLAELLLTKGYDVYGLVRRRSLPNLENIAHLVDRVHLLEGNLLDQSSLNAAVRQAEPDEIYNLAAQSFVGTSFVQPVLTGEITGLGVVRMLEATRAYVPEARFYQASSSEMFGHVDIEPQDETTPFHPRSPYGASKVFAHHTAILYRESYKLYVVSGIAHNHESERRGREFVTRRISDGVARIALGLSDTLSLGNPDARREWGYAPDFVRGFWMALQRDVPDDYVFDSGETHTVREFAEAASRVAGVDPAVIRWSTPSLLRPAEVDLLRGDASKAKRLLGWETEVRFQEIVERMVEADLHRLRAQGRFVNTLTRFPAPIGRDPGPAAPLAGDSPRARDLPACCPSGCHSCGGPPCSADGPTFSP